MIIKQFLSMSMGIKRQMIAPGVAYPTITTTTLPDGTDTGAYSQQLAVTGIAGGNWSTAVGPLPVGLTLSATGLLSGTIDDRSSSVDFTVKYTDPNGATDIQALTLTIADPPAIVETSLPDATVGVAYSENLTHSGGIGNGTWTVQAGSLPSGLSLVDNEDGTATISGTPDTVELAEFTLRFTDDNSVSDDQELSIDVVSGFPTFTVYGSDGMSGTGNVHADTFDAEFGGEVDTTWNSATAGNQVTEASGIATMLDSQAANEVMICTDAQWPSEPTDCALLVQGFKSGGEGGVRACFMIDRRDASNGDFIALQLQDGVAPSIVIGTVSLVTPIVTVASTTAFSAASVVGNTEKNYFARVIEVAGAGGGYTCELYEGTWEGGQSLATIESGMTLIESMDIFTAEARVMRDSAGTTTRGMIRRLVVDAADVSATFDGLHWGTTS